MLGSGKTGRVRASATASSARSRDSYQRYAVALYRQALLAPGDPAPAGQPAGDAAAGDAAAGEYALAPGAERGEDDAHYRLAESIVRRCHQLVAGPARHDRRPGLSGGLGSIRAGRVRGIGQLDMAVLVRTVRRKRTTSRTAAGQDGDQAGGAAAGGR